MICTVFPGCNRKELETHQFCSVDIGDLPLTIRAVQASPDRKPFPTPPASHLRPAEVGYLTTAFHPDSPLRRVLPDILDASPPRGPTSLSLSVLLQTTFSTARVYSSKVLKSQGD